ncbi:MAG: hypothetical protein SV375_22440 [Thermodesulfobacteriota bacterium]|nr:hypothetical protein [Thermodesulfobacteriota bacterium]
MAEMLKKLECYNPLISINPEKGVIIVLWIMTSPVMGRIKKSLCQKETKTFTWVEINAYPYRRLHRYFRR